MAINFDSVAIEWYNGSQWIDLSADVMTTPPPHGTRGILSTDINARLGNTGELTFTLRNSAANSARTEGYYTPGHPACLSPNWGKPYLYPVRIVIAYEDRYKYLWYGTFEPGPDGVKVVAGMYGPRTVECTFRDWMGLAQERKLNLLTVQTYQSVGNAARYLLSVLDADEQPQSTSIAYGDSTFPAVFDNLNNGTTTYTELGKLAQSELGYIYVRADHTTGECLVVESRSQRYLAGGLTASSSFNNNDGNLLKEDGDDLLLEDNGLILLNFAFYEVSRVGKSLADCGFLLKEDGDDLLQENSDQIILNEAREALFDDGDIQENRNMEVRHFDNAYQSARISSRQKRIDSTTVTLWAMESPLYITAGQTLTGVRGRYRDPSGGSSYVNGQDFVTPVSGTDWIANTLSDGTGTNVTANVTVTSSPGAAEVEFTIANAGDACYVTTLQQRGKGIYDYDSLDIVIGEDTGKKRIEINLNYETDANVGRAFAEDITRIPDGTVTIQRLPLYANRDDFNINAFMDLDIGSLIDVSEQVAYPDSASPFFINGYEFEIFPVVDAGTAHLHIIWIPNGFPYSRVYSP